MMTAWESNISSFNVSPKQPAAGDRINEISIGHTQFYVLLCAMKTDQ